MQISWESFVVFNNDARGIHYKFEDLCRQIFANENLSENNKYKYLYANPANPGIESEPIFDEVNGKWIGYQAKFFDGRPDYKEIEHSAQKTYEKYAGKVEQVFLFSNKSLTQASLKKTISILDEANISLIQITNEAILDLVRQKYPYLGFYYFGNHSISMSWFINHARYMFDELGERYNKEFSVHTRFSDELSLFVNDANSVNYINQKKVELLNEIKNWGYQRKDEKLYLQTLEESIKALSDVTVATLCDSFSWKDRVLLDIISCRKELGEKLNILQNNYQVQYDLAKSEGISQEEKNKAKSEYDRIRYEIRRIEKLLELPDCLEISHRERSLISSDVLVISGKAGMGKSHLIANETKALLDENREALILLGGIYFSKDPVTGQIMKCLELEFGFDELVDILENIGESRGIVVPVFIDALNETWNKKIWKIGLPAIIDKVKASRMVKLVLTYRSEYETLLISDALQKMKESKEIQIMQHHGFADNSIQAIKEFMNFYKIPFTPVEVLGYELSNPLFLSIFCKTYNGEEVRLPKLFDRLLGQVWKNLYRANTEMFGQFGYSEDDNVIELLVEEMALCMMQEGRSIPKRKLIGLSFWTTHGLSPIPIINALTKDHFLHDYVSEEEERYYFAFDYMNDYYMAKAIVKSYASEEALEKYLSDCVLEIVDGKIEKPYNVEIFTHANILCAEKFGSDCLKLLDLVNDDTAINDIISKYIAAFQWRTPQKININQFEDVVRKYGCNPLDLWRMLVSNSVKTNHPLNADYLHKLLSSYKLNKRDYLWTIQINDYFLEDGNRIAQLVEMYSQGGKIQFFNEKQVEHLLTLLCWLLTSNNRWIRDTVSKAIIEMLKEHFNLCIVLLNKFENIDDPYVLQRIYGIVFGACSKRLNREKQDFKLLASWVYEHVFDNDHVYPDILLRDYARLILELYHHEHPDDCGFFEYNKIMPPYSSEPIPNVEDQNYKDKEYEKGMLLIMYSMRFDGMGMGTYGDFGRYVFQSALRSFEVDDKKIFNYALYYIANDLEYREDYFGEYDSYCGHYDRSITIKRERIGKKYQWIAMHNILARVSDHCIMQNRWWNNKETTFFEGAWDPCVRDFDPTLNIFSMHSEEAPYFSTLDNYAVSSKNENFAVDLINDINYEWLNEEGIMFSDLKNIICLSDDDGTEWILLKSYQNTGHEELEKNRLLVWVRLNSFFVMKEQEEEFLKCAEAGINIITDDTNGENASEKVFQREYPWSPSCKSLNEQAWIEVSLETGEKTKETVQVPEINVYRDMLKDLGYVSDVSKSDFEMEDNESRGEIIVNISQKEIIQERSIKKQIGKILFSTTTLRWRAEYDASKEDTVMLDVPCAELINELGLVQMENNGFYYDKEGHLVAFDINLTQNVDGIVIKRKALDDFLQKTGMRIIWVVSGSKEIHSPNLYIERNSDWQALYTYDNGKINGCFHIMGQEES